MEEHEWTGAELKAQGQHVGRHRVARLMREAGLRARRRRRFVHTTDSKHGLPVAPNVLARDFNPSKPDRAWVTCWPRNPPVHKTREGSDSRRPVSRRSRGASFTVRP
ncbi:IS3 family transposase [Corallococcus exercitus]|uniref:IS3 family transposase n=1 Tax=Corallococcus exercitus TaxID=2316736 RepID=A0A7Y4NQR9_9BACT|nr:IS3 family transposase [Corallococcus exercitus]